MKPQRAHKTPQAATSAKQLAQRTIPASASAASPSSAETTLVAEHSGSLEAPLGVGAGVRTLSLIIGF